MNKTLLAIITCLIFAAAAIGQSKIPAAVPVKPGTRPRPARGVVTIGIEPGTVSGKTYTNKSFGFEITFPDTWLIPDKDFEEYMKKQGIDLSIKAPDWLPPVSRSMVEKAAQKVTILLTAYEKIPGMPDNSIVRISAEDLTLNPQVRDAVDYIDAIRTAYSQMKLPPDIKYSDTQVEKLGAMQFGYLDVNSAAGKKRMYVTVRDGYAILFTLSYTDPATLETIRDCLAKGNFHLAANN